MAYEPSEIEAHLNVNNETKLWSAYVIMPSVISKFRRAGFAPDRVDSGGAHYYSNIPFSCISIRADNSNKLSKPKKVMSEEHKAKLRAGREAKRK